MLRYILALFLVLLSVASVSAATVNVDVQIFKDETIFTYNFDFDNTDNFRSFSFERASDSRVDLAVNSLSKDVRYSLAGDFMIVQPFTGTLNESFRVRLFSKESSEQIFTEDSFATYTNFNFPVERLTFSIDLKEDLGEVIEFFPRSYQIDEEGKFVWEVDNVESDSLFLLKFEPRPETTSFREFMMSTAGIIMTVVIVILVIVVIVFAVLGIRRKKRVKAEEQKKKKKAARARKSNAKAKKGSSKAATGKKVATVKSKKEIEEEHQKSYEETVNKFLTDNEKEVVEVVKNNSGISQYDILNHLPKLTKSNLSKIISKLNSRKFLNRIRVGKVNKIYLGEKLEPKKDEGVEKGDGGSEKEESEEQ